MDGRGRAAMIGPSGPGARSLPELLAARGYALVGQTPDGPSGLELIRALQPDLVVARAVMPGMDGVIFVRRARELRLNPQPGILLLRPAGLRLPDEASLPALGAVTADMPLTPEGLQDALARLDRLPRALPPEKAARLEALLDALGVPRHRGRDCLTRAVALAWRDERCLHPLKDGLYPELARQTGLTCAQVERAIRHVIEVAWRAGEIEQQHRIFGDTIDARRGKPTCGEMIAQLAEELRWEA